MKRYLSHVALAVMVVITLGTVYAANVEDPKMVEALDQSATTGEIIATPEPEPDVRWPARVLLWPERGAGHKQHLNAEPEPVGIAEPLPPEAAAGMLVNMLLKNEITKESTTAAAKKGLTHLPVEIQQALPAGFEEAFLEEYRKQVPGIRKYAKKVYLEVYTLEQLTVLYEMNRTHPWMKDKGVRVATEIMAYTSVVGEEVGKRVGGRLQAEQSVRPTTVYKPLGGEETLEDLRKRIPLPNPY